MERKEHSYCTATGKKMLGQKEAGTMINAAKRHTKSDKKWRSASSIPQRFYYCRDCGTYHLTSQKSWDYEKD